MEEKVHQWKLNPEAAKAELISPNYGLETFKTTHQIELAYDPIRCGYSADISFLKGYLAELELDPILGEYLLIIDRSFTYTADSSRSKMILSQRRKAKENYEVTYYLDNHREKHLMGTQKTSNPDIEMMVTMLNAPLLQFHPEETQLYPFTKINLALNTANIKMLEIVFNTMDESLLGIKHDLVATFLTPKTTV